MYKIVGTEMKFLCEGKRQSIYFLFYWQTCMPYQYNNHLTRSIAKCKYLLNKQLICAKICPIFEIQDCKQGRPSWIFDVKGHRRFLKLDITLYKSRYWCDPF